VSAAGPRLHRGWWPPAPRNLPLSNIWPPTPARRLLNILYKGKANPGGPTITTHQAGQAYPPRCRCCLRARPGREAYPGDVSKTATSPPARRAPSSRDAWQGQHETALPIIENPAATCRPTSPPTVISDHADGQNLSSPLICSTQAYGLAINVASRWSPGRRRCPDQGDQEDRWHTQTWNWLSFDEWRPSHQFFASDLDATTQKQLGRGIALRAIASSSRNSAADPGRAGACGLCRCQGPDR